MIKSMATELGESTQVKANLAFVAKVIAIVGSVEGDRDWETK